MEYNRESPFRYLTYRDQHGKGGSRGSESWGCCETTLKEKGALPAVTCDFDYPPVILRLSGVISRTCRQHT